MVFRKRRLIHSLRRLAKLLARYDQASRADALRMIAESVAKAPEQAARRTLAQFEGAASLDRLVLTSGGRAFMQTRQEQRDMFEFPRLRWDLYELALRLWRQTKTASPLGQIENADPIQKLADYGGGNEVWRKGRAYILRSDVGAHVSLWRDDKISRREAEQAVLGPDHFYHLGLKLQRKRLKRGVDPNQGSVVPLPDPAFDRILR